MDKKQKKEHFQKSCGLKVGGGIPIILVSDVDEHIQIILKEIVDGIASIGLQMVMVRPEKGDTLNKCQEWVDKHPSTITLIEKKEADSDVFDIAVLEDLTTDKLEDMKEHRRVPVADKGMIEPFDPIQEKGNGFLYEQGNPWSLFAALIRASETYRFPYDWNNIIKAGQNVTPMAQAQ